MEIVLCYIGAAMETFHTSKEDKVIVRNQLALYWLSLEKAKMNNIHMESIRHNKNLK